MWLLLCNRYCVIEQVMKCILSKLITVLRHSELLPSRVVDRVSGYEWPAVCCRTTVAPRPSNADLHTNHQPSCYCHYCVKLNLFQCHSVNWFQTAAVACVSKDHHILRQFHYIYLVSGRFFTSLHLIVILALCFRFRVHRRHRTPPIHARANCTTIAHVASCNSDKAASMHVILATYEHQLWNRWVLSLE